MERSDQVYEVILPELLDSIKILIPTGKQLKEIEQRLDRIEKIIELNNRPPEYVPFCQWM